jgi:hypothetical protein
MKNWKQKFMVIALVLMGFTSAHAASNVSFSVGTDDFYLSVGNYDYLPYAYDVNPGYSAPPINFVNVMADYGGWVYVPTFGQVWRPYVDASWRPYVNGHWIYTSYGPTWQGYEPWAWAAYHYGNWIWSERYGWVWIPGYDWHPGRVVWSRSYDTVGWMPAPPNGYDYSRGYLYYRGNVNQFTYNDPNFFDDDYGYGYGGGGYYNQGYDDLYYNPNYANISVNLWVFINRNHYGYDNYADYYLDRDYTRDVFRRRAVRIHSQPVERAQLEKVVRTRINEVPVRVKEVQADRRKVKMVIPEGEENNVRKNANRVVNNMIAPAFAERQKEFKGLKATNEKSVAKIFNQENKQPRIQTVSSEEIINKAKENNKRRDDERVKVSRQEIEKVDRVEKEVKAKNPNAPKPKPSVELPPSASDQNMKTKPSQGQNPNLNSSKPKQNEVPSSKPNLNEPSNKNKDRDSQFSSDNDKNKNKNPYQNPNANEDRLKKQSDDQIREADQNRKKAEEQWQQAEDSKKKAQEQWKKANETSGPNSEKMKQDAESQMKDAEQNKKAAEEQIQNADESKQQAQEQAQQTDSEKKKKADQNKKNKDKDKDKDKPPRRSH